jgi:hypothetical protein
MCCRLLFAARSADLILIPVYVISRLSRWFRSHWQDAEASQELRAHFRRAQTRSLAQCLVFTEPAIIVITLVLFVLLRNQVPSTLLLSWTAISLAISLTALTHTVRVLRTPER